MVPRDVTSDVPPYERNGSVSPVKGISEVVTAMLTIA